LIGEQKANISDLEFVDRKPDFYRLRVDVDLRDVEHLHMVMTALEAENDVAELARLRRPSHDAVAEEGDGPAQPGAGACAGAAAPSSVMSG
jgi:hypothetical protein